MDELFLGGPTQSSNFPNIEKLTFKKNNLEIPHAMQKRSSKKYVLLLVSEH